MSKQFRQLVEKAKKGGCVGELIQCGGEYDTMPEDAIAQDWQHALLQAQTDLAEDMRFLSGDEGDYRRKCARRHLAVLVAVAETLEANLKNL